MSEMKAGIKEIARMAGVSTATVSRVLNGNKTVNSEMAEKVIAVAASLGYQPSPAARYMRSKKSGLLGIVVPDLSKSYFGDIVNGAISKAREYNQMMVVGTVEGKSGTEKEFLRKLSGYMLDGLIYCPVSTDIQSKKTEVPKIPLVIAGRRRVLDGVPHVNTDDENTGYLSARYLLNLGRRNIGFLAGFWESAPFKDAEDLLSSVNLPISGAFSALDRIRGFQRALREEGLELKKEKLAFCGFDAESGYTAVRELFSRLNKIDALMVPNCLVARGVFRFFNEQGISVPKEISLISLDDMHNGELLAVPVTSITHDMYSLGMEAVILLNQVIQNKKPQDKIIDVKLIIRQSTSKEI